MESVLKSHGPCFVVGTLDRPNRAGNERVTREERNGSSILSFRSRMSAFEKKRNPLHSKARFQYSPGRCPAKMIASASAATWRRASTAANRRSRLPPPTVEIFARSTRIYGTFSSLRLGRSKSSNALEHVSRGFSRTLLIVHSSLETTTHSRTPA